MAQKIKNPQTIAIAFNIDPEILEHLGVVNALLNTDTLLFIDPLLLPDSRHIEMSVNALASYDKRFSQIISYLSVSKGIGDVAWKAAKKLFKFSEISWTCLGYGNSVRGSGFGEELRDKTLNTAFQIVSLGISDVELFMGLALFEDGIGPDRISDMTTNIIIEDLFEFTTRINDVLKIPTSKRTVLGKQRDILVNPFSGDPLVLVPSDVVRDLPIASDWSSISGFVKQNHDLRDRVNQHIGEIFANMTSRHKAHIKDSALTSKVSFGYLLEMLREVPPIPYNFQSDLNGEIFWADLMYQISQRFPFDLTAHKQIDSIEKMHKVVTEIVEQFRDLVENKGLWKTLWDDNDNHRKEKAAQRVFFAVAFSYCKANNLDISPEADSGNGPVDFKISHGFNSKIVVEIKLSDNSKLVHGYEKQLEIYKKAENTDLGIFLIIDVGHIGNKFNDVQRIKREQMESIGKASEIWLVDANQKESASKRK